MATATRSKKAKQLKQLVAKRANLLQSAQIIHDFEEHYDPSQQAEGDAARIISSLPISAHSYIVAWKLITDRYEDKNLLIKQHISALFSVSPLSEESAAGLSELADEFEKHVKILDSLETKAQHWDSVLVELLFSRMDATSQKQWESTRDKTARPLYDDLIKFIHQYSRTLQSLQLSQTVCAPTLEAKPSKPRCASNHSAAEQPPRCAACQQAHFLFQCDFFRNQTPHQRFDLVKRNNLCINCIKATHQARNCSSGSCKYCQKKHHTLLHLPSSASLITTEAPPHNRSYTTIPNLNLSHSPSVPLNSDPDVTSVNRSISLPSPSVFAPRLPSPGTVTPPSTSCQTVTPSKVDENTVILFTALVNIHDNHGTRQMARALLDSGSQSSFISESLCQRLSLNRTKINMPVNGIGQSIVNVRYAVSVNISSRFSAQHFPLDCLVLPKLTVNLPTKTVNISSWRIPKHLPLADPQFFQCHGIDLIIGAELLPFILQPEQIHFDDQLPPLQKTSFGYVFSGKVPTSATTPVTCLVSTFDNLDAQVKKFWEVENFDTGKCFSAEEQLCEAHFVSTHCRNSEGRYVVRLPVREELLPSIGDTWSTAARRFSAVERRFRSDETLHKSYAEFMEEYERLGHMEEVMTRVALPQYFLPHHAVIRPESSTTRIRVVFDGSSKSSNQLSLNDLLLTGPTVQPPMLCTVINFRFHRFVMKADVEKMFRQILVHPDDRNLQQIAWRKSENEPLKIYRLNTVTYGTSCAPFLSTRVLNQLADDEGRDFPLAAAIIKEDCYIDDVLTGATTIEALLDANKQLNGLFARGGFSLRKWSANHPSILEQIPDDLKEDQTSLELDRSSSIKTLGLLWFPKEDNFGFKVPELQTISKLTKRTVLSEMSSLFDPLGLVGPVVASAKMFVQQLWQEKLDWDEELQEPLRSWWLSFRTSISSIRNLRVPRWVFGENVKQFELHCFVDASSKGYGACIYAVSGSSSTILTSNLLIAKSRVAPVSGYSTPRLELCAAVLGSQLADNICKATKFASKITFWSDSSIVLHWISSSSSSWKIFVSNRVAEVQKLSEGAQWRHVPTQENPADRLSRGMQPEDIEDDMLWWHGPSFLLEPPSGWPDPIIPLSATDVQQQSTEQRQIISFVAVTYDDSLIRRGASVKVWVAVYVCFAVKAVVLDIVAGLSTESCVNSLRRFVSRVGRVRTIHCDNSTTFVGAFREIKEMRQVLVDQLSNTAWTTECLERGIEFQFIPPRAPHFGGLWEAAVKAFKRLFLKTIGAAPHHYDDMRTAVAQAECIMNSRPLTPLSNDPQDLSALTPGHFLLGESIYCLPEPDLSEVPTNRLNHFQATQRSVTDLWKRWSKEYIGLLHQRPAKWRKTPTEFRVGTMVLVKKDDVPSKQWPLGRVVAVFPGNDNIVRVVDVRTQLGVRRRATSELCVLPTDNNQ
ncbi:uncharacterized protein LOC134289096 [Aedes albopictus]|uniref:Integrase catalytic domain-containing protein n=1 Tax=Aedes albopictus TaxID=7160 RepID=A0ABM1YT80_AEDAL